MARNVATVDDFEKLKNELGLVPMEFLVSTITEHVGDIRGAEPYTALRWYNEGIAQPLGKLDAKPAAQQQAALDPEDIRKSKIEIPATIGEAHHLQRIGLAKQIAGLEANASLKLEEADRIIADERTRRASGGAVGPNAVTTAKTVTP